MADWLYSGDASLEYGGFFADLANWRWGYANVVRVEDLDSAIGFRGACLIEHLVVSGVDNLSRIRQALSCVGGINRRGRRRPEDHQPANRQGSLRLEIVYALLAYGFYDPDDAWDNHRSSYSETVQLEPDGPMAFDSWKAAKRLRGGDLEGYVRAVHLH